MAGRVVEASFFRIGRPKIEPLQHGRPLNLQNEAAPILQNPFVMSIWLALFLLFPLVLSARTPSIHEVQEEALRVAGYDRLELEEWRQRSRWSSALPRLQVGFDRQLKDLVKLSTRDNVSVTGGEVFVGPDENDFDQDVQQGIGIEVKAVWSLDELIFSRDRLEVSRERRNWLEDRNRLLERVNEAYFLWKRVPGNVREEWAGRLDGYTAGWFSRELGSQS